MKKKILAISLSMALAFTMSAGGEMKTIIEDSREEYLSQGIQHMSISRQTLEGPVEIDVLKIDLDDRYTDLKPVYSEELSERDKLASIADQWSATAAVNGDFFNMGNPSFPFGTLLDGDDIISSPNSKLYNFPTIVKDGNDFDISIIEPYMTLEVDGQVLPVAAVNKLGAFKDEIIVLNSAWGEESLGSTDTRRLVEIVIYRNRVKSINIGEDPVDIPSSGYVIAFNADNSEILDKFDIRDKVSFDVEFGFDIDEIDWAAGGVNHLLKDGLEGEYNNDVLGRHPRTAIGFTEDEETAYLITVDGRSEDSIGMLQSELLQLMLDLGCWNGVNLDGGGSSEMVVDYYGKGDYQIVNAPSDGNERLLVSGLGVFDSHSRSTTVKSLEVFDLEDKLFKGQYLSFDVRAYNRYKVPVVISDSRISIKAKGLDYKKDSNGIQFLESGRAEVTISYGSSECQFQVQVLGDVQELYSQVDSISINEDGQYDLPDFIGVDGNGNTAVIKAQEMDWSLTERIADIDDGILEARSKSGKGILEGEYDNGQVFIPLAVGSVEKLIEDFEDLKGLKLTQYPEDSDGRMISHSKNKEGSDSVKIFYDFTTMKPDDQSIAFVEFGEKGLVLPDQPESLSMWVYGDKSDHWLRCRVTDADGIQYKIDFAEEIDWYGWKEVTAVIPDGISYPLVLDNVYIAEIYNDKADDGYIYLDGLKAHYPLGCYDIEVPEASKVEDVLMNVPEEFELKLHMGVDNTDEYIYEEDTIEAENPDGSMDTQFLTEIISPVEYTMTDEDGNMVYDQEDIVFVKLLTLYESINSYDISQWDRLLELKEYVDKTMIVKTDIDFNSIKSSERSTLKTYLKYLGENNSIFVVSEGTEDHAGISYDNGMRFVRYATHFTLYLTDDKIGFDYK